MRILIISDVSSRMRGGVPAETRTLIRGLVDRGHQVALASDVPLVGSEQAIHLPITLPVGAAITNEIGSALDSFKPEFVHVLCMSSRGVLLLAPLLRSRSWALTVHSVPPYERKLQRWHGRETLHYAARALRFFGNSVAWRWVFLSAGIPRVIVHSRYVEDIVVRYGLERRRVISIPLPFESVVPALAAAQPARGEGALSLVTVAGFAHTKGQHDMIKALPELLKKFPLASYQIIGEVRDESYMTYLRDLCQRLDVADHVSMTPDLGHAEKQAALARADVYVQPSHEEGFCLAFAEAAALVPRLVGTHTGAIAAISQDDPGARVVPVRQPGAIASAISDLMRTTLPVEHMRDRALRLAERCAMSGYVRAHEDIYLHRRESRA